MDVLVNGTPWSSEPTATVADVVRHWCPASGGVAVARNQEVVPRSQWPTTLLAPGDRIEIVSAVAGG